MRKEAVGHLDADCFYVSAERVRDSFLLKKPVGVLGNQGACVIAKSYEMKAAGVQTGEPIWEAIVKCPQGIYLKRDFRWYEVLSRQMLAIVQEFSPQVEFYSVDEFFFTALPLPGLTFQATAEVIRDRLWQETSVPVTVGIARTKTLAKLISDNAKPFGASAVLDAQAETELLAQRLVTDITGIAKRRGDRLRPYGILTCLDFAKADRRLIRRLLTVVGETLWYEINGDPIQPMHTQRPPHKALSRGGSIGQATAAPEVIWAWLVRNLERLIEELEYHVVQVGHLTLWLGYQDGPVNAGKVTLGVPTDRFDLLLEAARSCFQQAYVPRHAISRMHLIATKLQYRKAVQLGLFEPPVEKAKAVARLKRDVNGKHGRFTLRSGVTLYLEDVYRDSANAFDICDVRGKMCF